MNILFLTRSLPIHATGGMERHAELLIKGMAELGHELTVITTGHPGGKTQESWDHIVINYLAGTTPGKYSKKWWHSSKDMALKIFRQQNIDIIYSMSAGAFALMKMERMPPIVVGATGTAYGEMLTKFRQTFSWKKYPGIIKNLYNWYHTKKLLPYADKIIACSDQVKTELVTRFNVSDEKVSVVIPGIDTQRFNKFQNKKESLKEKLNINDKDITILFVSRLKKEKGIMFLLDGFKKISKSYPNLKLIISGDGEEKKNIDKFILTNKLSENIKCIGNISYDEIPKIFSIADIFAFPTLRNEGLPLVVLEGIAARKILLCSDIPQIKQGAADYEASVFFHANNREDFLGKFRDVIDNIDSFKKKTEVISCAVSNIDYHTMAERTIKVLEEVVIETHPHNK
ncbi:glycosyltransferase family 4 protein [bacterium]